VAASGGCSSKDGRRFVFVPAQTWMSKGQIASIRRRNSPREKVHANCNEAGFSEVGKVALTFCYDLGNKDDRGEATDAKQ
jgi:hypothetical protein